MCIVVFEKQKRDLTELKKVMSKRVTMSQVGNSFYGCQDENQLFWR